MSSLVNWSSKFTLSSKLFPAHVFISSKDSMGNTEILKWGSLQMTSTGTRISHSKKAHGSKQVQFLQICSLPHTLHLPSKYFTHELSSAKKDTWVHIIAPVGSKGILADKAGRVSKVSQSNIGQYPSSIEPLIAHLRQAIIESSYAYPYQHFININVTQLLH